MQCVEFRKLGSPTHSIFMIAGEVMLLIRASAEASVFQYCSSHHAGWCALRRVMRYVDHIITKAVAEGAPQCMRPDSLVGISLIYRI
jgi:hypothetical protein